MASRLRLSLSIVLLGAALVFSLAGVVSSGASVKARGKVVSASLTKTSFTAAKAKTVKLKYRISPASKRFGYLLSLKKGSKWVKVRSVNKRGSFKGSYKMTVKKLFGSKAVKVGQYRVKVSADANSLTRRFRVVRAPRPAPGAFNKTSPANGATGQALNVVLSWESSSNAASYEYCVDTTNDGACGGSWVSTGSATSRSPGGLLQGATYYWQVRARNAQGTTDANAGYWFSFTTVVQPTAGFWLFETGANINFYVTPTHENVTYFMYTFDAPGCDISGGTITVTSLVPITSGAFSIAGSFSVSGSFDSATSAHGTVELDRYFIFGCGYLTQGPFDWTATWHNDSQPSGGF